MAYSGVRYTEQGARIPGVPPELRNTLPGRSYMPYEIRTIIPTKTKLIASEASCSMRAVKKIRSKRQHFERSIPRTAMREALLDKLTEQPYLYRYKIADFFYHRFGKRVSERSIGQTLRSMG